MKNTLHFSGLCCVALVMAACATTPAPQSLNSPAPAATPAATPEASSDANAAERRFQEAAKGYRLVVSNGQNHYCRNEKASGSNIVQQNCVTENELRAAVEDAERYRRAQRASVCKTDDPRCGAGKY
jgi:hypothetical protein